MSGDVFAQLSLVIVLAATLAMLMRLLRQPLIIGHIITGILVGPSVFKLVDARNAFEAFSKIGITLLLFIIGLELNAAVVRRMGRTVIVSALALLAFMGGIGFSAAAILGFKPNESVLIGLALFFSSTIIIAKVLSDKKELSRLHGQIAIGIILLDDVVATIALLFVAAGKNGFQGPSELLWLAAKGIALVLVFSFIGLKVLPRLGRFMAESQELLFLFSLAWGFGIATLVSKVGFSVEVGALFAGVALAQLPYAAAMGSRLKPLRDFFVVVFFITLGEGLSLGGLQAALLPAVVFAVLVLVMKPVIVMAALGLLGYTKRTGFKAAINLSQISEFSIILIVLAAGTGLVGHKVSSVITLVALITIAISTYLMQYDNAIYRKLENGLRIFERAETKEHEMHVKNYPIILFGYKKGGHEFVKTFHDMEKPFLVVDYNPDVMDLLDRQHIPSLYGDVTDPELLAELHLPSMQLAVSTIADQPTNLALVRYIHHHNPDAAIICPADDHDEAAQLYSVGASYVILPHLIGSERIGTFLARNGLDKQSFEEFREKHLMAIGRIAASS